MILIEKSLLAKDKEIWDIYKCMPYKNSSDYIQIICLHMDFIKKIRIFVFIVKEMVKF